MIEFIFETGINLIETFISVDFITKYLGPKYKNRLRSISFIIVWMVLFAELTIINRITEFETFASYIPMIILTCYALLCLCGNKILKIWISILTHLIVIFTSIMTNILLCNIIGYDPYKMITVFNSTRVMGVIIAKIMQFYITRLILRNKYKNPISNYRWVAIIAIPVISVISLCALMKAALINNGISPYILTGMICIILANIMTYYFFTVMNKEYENTIKAKLLEQQNETLKKSIADKDAFVKEMKTVRHDIKNQLLTIMQYANEGKTDEIKEYVNVLTNNYLPNILNYINTNNAAFDAVINSKIAVCNQKNIFMEVNIKQDTDISIPPAEIAVLFGNLLDNSIEAAKHTDEKRISLDIQKNASYLIILVSNSIKSSVLTTNENLETSKSDKELHGIGIKSIKNIVEKHNGMIQFYEEENEFCCHIMIDLAE
jgi:two-component system, LytTR family, sensor histidine kinase AgrC